MRKIGIIGAGNMGMLHGKLLKRREGVEVAGLTDLDPSRGKAAAASLGCRFHSTVDALLGSGIDMVFITVPNTAHAGLAVRGLEAGLDVFVEKPLATSLADADKVLDAEKRSGGRRVFVGYNRRFAPVYEEARRLIAKKGFKPANVNIIQNDGDMRNPPWLTDVSLTGGFMYDTTVHFLDMAVYLLGEIAELRALGKNFFYPIADSFVVQLSFTGGAIGAITTCGHASWISPFERVQAAGDHQSVLTEELDQLHHSPGLGAVIDSRSYAKLDHETKWGYARMHDHIFACLKKGGKALNGSREGRRTVELIEACHRSAGANGEIVRFK